MASPALSSTYVEAYVARLQSMAILLHRGASLRLDDFAYPINTEFLYFTRVGMVQLMRLVNWIFGGGSDWGLRVLTLASFALLAFSAVRFGRRWSAEPVWVLAAILVLTPGILESSFFFADNLPSAALAALALALVSGNVSAVRWLAIGGLLGSATLVRLDAVLVAPMVVAVLWLATRDLRKMGLAIAYGLIGAAIVFAVSAHATGVALPLALRVGHEFKAVNGSDLYAPGFGRTVRTARGFFGVITAICALVGFWSNFQRKPASWSIVMGLMPILFFLAVLPKANEVRDFSLLGVLFVVLQGGTGLREILQTATAKSDTRRWAALAVLLVFAVVLFGPPRMDSSDGPRPFIGRVWSPIFWRQWQHRTSEALQQLSEYVDTIRPGERILVVNPFYEPDRYLNLTLLQKGFSLLPPSGAENCQSVQIYSRNGTTVYSIRTENPYGLSGKGLIDTQLAALQFTTSLTCLNGLHFDRIAEMDWGGRGLRLGEAAPLAQVTIPSPSFFLRPLHHQGRIAYPALTIKNWTAADLKQAAAFNVQLLADARKANVPVPSYSDFERDMQARNWVPKGEK